MEIKLIPLEKFLLEIDGKSIGVFERVSSWEGFMKFENNEGVVITADDSNIFEDVCSRILEFGRQSSLKVIKISPNLIPKESKEQ
jgi:hypothetical protein